MLDSTPELWHMKARDVKETYPGVAEAAAAIRRPERKALGIVAVAGLMQRMGRSRLVELGRLRVGMGIWFHNSTQALHVRLRRTSDRLSKLAHIVAR